jgi:hypothetical protein
MEQIITLTLKRADAEELIKCLQHRQERLCDIKREICPAETADPYEHEQCGYFEREDEVVGRVLEALRVGLETNQAA